MASYKEKECKQCRKITKNPVFCSKSCAATYNNKISPKRKYSKTCKVCSVKTRNWRILCDKCYEEKSRGLGDMTLAQAVKTYAKHHKSSAFALVRARARSIAKKLGYTNCAKCGYDKHVEIAHIKAISSFDLSELISVINAPENLIALCPNCHWELDHQK